MKKDIKTKRDKAVRSDEERLSDKAVLLTALTILYAFLLLFLQRMSMSSTTVLGAQAFIEILFWGSIIGAMACAAWGAYREKRGMFTYSGVFVYIRWSTAVIQYCGNMGSSRAYTLVYVSLVIAFALVQLYFGLLSAGKLGTKRGKTVFTASAALLFVAFTLAAIALRFRFFGLLG